MFLLRLSSAFIPGSPTISTCTLLLLPSNQRTYRFGSAYATTFKYTQPDSTLSAVVKVSLQQQKSFVTKCLQMLYVLQINYKTR